MPDETTNHLPNGAPDQPVPVAPPGAGPGQLAGDTPRRDSLGDTVGTGSIIAIGCIGGTVFLIALGLLFLLVTQLF